MNLLWKNESVIAKKSNLLVQLNFSNSLLIGMDNLKVLQEEIHLPKDFLDRDLLDLDKSDNFFANVSNSSGIYALLINERKFFRLPFQGLKPVIIDVDKDNVFAIVQALPSYHYKFLSLSKKDFTVKTIFSYREKRNRFISGKLSPNKSMLALVSLEPQTKKSYLNVFTLQPYSLTFRKELNIVGENIFWLNEEKIIFLSLKGGESKLFTISIETGKVESFFDFNVKNFLVANEYLIWKSPASDEWFESPLNNLKDKKTLLEGLKSYYKVNQSSLSADYFIFFEEKKKRQRFFLYQKNKRIKEIKFPYFFVKDLFQ